MSFSQSFALDIAAWIDATHSAFPLAPTNIWLSLHDSVPVSDNVGASEIVANGYNRAEIVFASTVPSDQEVLLANSNVVVFPTATGNNALPITHFAIWDSFAAGTAIGFGAWTAPASWVIATTFTIPVGQVVLPLITRIATVT